MIVVSNTSPISNLAKVGQLSLISQLYGRILIPWAVYEELLDPRAGETVITAVRSAPWIDIQSVQNQGLVNDLRTRVNVGEAEAIALAIAFTSRRKSLSFYGKYLWLLGFVPRVQPTKLKKPGF